MSDLNHDQLHVTQDHQFIPPIEVLSMEYIVFKHTIGVFHIN